MSAGGGGSWTVTAIDKRLALWKKGYFEPVLDLTSERPLAALFTSDGKAIVHALHGCEMYSDPEAFGRYDIASGVETIVTLGTDSKRLYGISALGQLAFEDASSMGAGLKVRLLPVTSRSWPRRRAAYGPPCRPLNGLGAVPGRRAARRARRRTGEPLGVS